MSRCGPSPAPWLQNLLKGVILCFFFFGLISYFCETQSVRWMYVFISVFNMLPLWEMGLNGPFFFYMDKNKFAISFLLFLNSACSSFSVSHVQNFTHLYVCVVYFTVDFRKFDQSGRQFWGVATEIHWSLVKWRLYLILIYEYSGWTRVMVVLPVCTGTTTRKSKVKSQWSVDMLINN